MCGYTCAGRTSCAEPSAAPVAFGLSNGTRDVYPEEQATGVAAHCRAAGNPDYVGMSISTTRSSNDYEHEAAYYEYTHPYIRVYTPI